VSGARTSKIAAMSRCAKPSSAARVGILSATSAEGTGTWCSRALPPTWTASLGEPALPNKVHGVGDI
jgi:hypothetical protein